MFRQAACVGVLNRGKVFVPPTALFIKYQLKNSARFDIVQKRFPHSGFCGVDNKQIKFIVFVHIQVSPLQLLFVHGTTKPQQPCRFRNGNHKAAAAISGSVAIRSSPSTAKKKSLFVSPVLSKEPACSAIPCYAVTQRTCRFGNSVLCKELADDINDFSTDALLSFGGGSTDMGGAADMGDGCKEPRSCWVLLPKHQDLLHKPYRC